MKMLDLDLNEINKLGKITKEEAKQFLEEGEPIVCRTSRRDFHEISIISDLDRVLSHPEVYDMLEFYIQ